MEEFFSKSDRDTLKIGEAFAKSLTLGDVVLLSGEMGAGKTVFTKGVAKGLGIKTEVVSPTYAYLNVYGALYHYDCYRLSSGEDAESLGLTDYFNEPNIICVIEWSENIKSALPKNCKKVRIEKISKTKRKIIIE